MADYARPPGPQSAPPGEPEWPDEIIGRIVIGTNALKQSRADFERVLDMEWYAFRAAMLALYDRDAPWRR